MAGPLPASIPPGWRNNRWRKQDVSYQIGGELIEVLYEAGPDGSFEVEASGSPSKVRVMGFGDGEIGRDVG